MTDIVVVDNGQTYVSEETAVIATEAARQAKQWAEESERQANIATVNADTAVGAKDDAVEAKEYAEAAITDTNLITVATDLQDEDSNIKTVAQNITNINTVAANNANITAVAGNTTNINAVNANKTNIDKVAGDINRVNLVADDISSVHTVAVDISNVNDVANNKTNIDTVATNISNVNAVAGISSDVSTVAGIASDVTAVKNNATNINAVAGNNSNITAVAGNTTNINAVNANKTNIDTVATNISNVSGVAGDLTNINNVAGDLANIDAVGSNITNINTVAGDHANIQAVVNNMTAINAAPTYANNAKKWAEGTDSEVTPLGGTHSAKGWAEIAEEAASGVQNPANRDLSNLNPQGQNIANWSTNVTNCITEIPQDIKLELNNGTLTVKAGSKVYYPNGTNTFDTIILNEDKTVRCENSGTFFVIPVLSSMTFYCNRISSVTVTSDSEVPAQYTGYVYNTTDNEVYFWANGVKQTKHTFPVGLVKVVSGVPTSIEQVFNGFVYIGSTVFALPGVKGLIPNGRNEDGSLKNIDFTINSVLTTTDVSGATGGLEYYVNANGIYRANFGQYTYDEQENKIVDTSGNRFSAVLIDGNAHRTSGKVDRFVPKTAFQAVDYNDFAPVKAQVDTNTTALTTKANDNDVVKLSGSQTIAGNKTFTSIQTIKMTQPNLYMQYTGISKGTAPESTVDGWFGTVYDKNGTAQANKMAQIYHDYSSNGASTLNLSIFEPTSGSSIAAKLTIGYDQNKNIFTEVPRPTADTTSSTQIDSVGARNTKINDVLSALYPVGSVYIGTQATCPLSTLISGSTWTLVSSGKVLQGADNDHAAGTTISAGLPNITGELKRNNSIKDKPFFNDSRNDEIGALGQTYDTTSFFLQDGNGSAQRTIGITFDASKSNSIYGNSTTVQPPAYVVNIWERTA